MRFRRCATWVCVVLVNAVTALRTVGSQEIRGTVRGAGSITFAAGVIVEATPVHGTDTTRRTLTNDRGYFALRLGRAGEYRIRALRIGLHPTELGSISIRDGETRTVQFELTGRAVELDRIDIVAPDVCSNARERLDLRVGLLYEEARKAVRSTLLTTSAGRLSAEWTVSNVMTTLAGQQIGEPVRRDVRAFTDQPFVSLSPDSLERLGYLSTEGATWVYHAPDAHVLLSERFVLTNCFTAVPWDKDSADWTGLRFRPTRNPPRGNVLIEGELWIDRTTAELRRLDYRYVGLPRELAGTNAGGTVEFAKLPTGGWIVSAWSIRMPRPVLDEESSFGSVTRRGVGMMRTQRTMRVNAMELANGVVRTVRRDGVVVFAPDVVRSVVRTRSSSDVASLCHESGRPPEPMAWGTIANAAGESHPDLDVTASWRTRHRWFASNRFTSETESRTVRTLAGGFWFICQLPAETPVEFTTRLVADSLITVVTSIAAAADPAEVAFMTGESSGRRIDGRIVDSLSLGLRFDEAVVYGAGTPARAAVTDAGDFSIRGVANAGGRVLAVLPSYEFLKLGSIAGAVPPDSSSERPIVLSTPSPERATAHFCGTPLPPGQGVVIGEVRDGSRIARPGLVVRASWEIIEIVAGRRTASARYVSDTTTPEGSFALCGVPTAAVLVNLDSSEAPRGGARLFSGQITVAAASDRFVSGGVFVNPAGAVVVRRDLVVGDRHDLTIATGRVVDHLRRPVVGAIASITSNPELTATADSTGRWAIDSVPMSSGTLVVRALGYAPRVVEIDPLSRRIEVGEIRLDRLAQELSEIRVTATPSERRQRFERRRAAGVGVFLDDDWIKSMPYLHPTIVRTMIPKTRLARDTVPGQTSRYKIAFERDAGMSAMSLCFPRFWVDGADFGVPSAVDEEMFLRQAIRIEIYRATEAPAEFRDQGGCGAVVIWTYDAGALAAADAYIPSTFALKFAISLATPSVTTTPAISRFR